MFIQHQQNIPGLLSSDQLSTADFELVIIEKSKAQVHCTIYFDYLQESFECTVLLTPTSIQLSSVYPFTGILTTAPSISLKDHSTEQYLNKEGAVTKNGHQNIIWLIQDVIHLYNLTRLNLKAKSLINLYREVFTIAKLQSPTIEFGKINVQDTFGNEVATIFSAKLKLKYKYLYSDAKALLQSVQNLLFMYPDFFATPLKIVS